MLTIYNNPMIHINPRSANDYSIHQCICAFELGSLAQWTNWRWI